MIDALLLQAVRTPSTVEEVRARLAEMGMVRSYISVQLWLSRAAASGLLDSLLYRSPISKSGFILYFLLKTPEETVEQSIRARVEADLRKRDIRRVERYAWVKDLVDRPYVERDIRRRIVETGIGGTLGKVRWTLTQRLVRLVEKGILRRIYVDAEKQPISMYFLPDTDPSVVKARILEYREILKTWEWKDEWKP